MGIHLTFCEFSMMTHKQGIQFVILPRNWKTHANALGEAIFSSIHGQKDRLKVLEKSNDASSTKIGGSTFDCCGPGLCSQSLLFL
jgi:hypothetical protein